MFTNVNLLYVALAVGSLLVLRLLLSRDDPKKDELWNQLDKVGIPSGLLPWTRAAFASWTALLRNTNEGYRKFCKQGRPFALPTIWTGKAVVLSYFIPDQEVIANVIHFEVSRKDLTKRNVDRQLAPTAEEVDACFRTLWGVSTEWTTVNGWDRCGQIIARVALRTLLGFPICRDEELVKATQSFANNLFTAAAIINCMPPALRPILGPILALPTKHYRTRYRKIVVPVIKERIRLREEHEKTGEGELPLGQRTLHYLYLSAPSSMPMFEARSVSTNFIEPKIQFGYIETKKDSWTTSLTPEFPLGLADHVDIAHLAAAAFQDPTMFHGRELGVVSENLLVVCEAQQRTISLI
ncbi:hypothetical protein F4810DRAFT_708355 [Camillea tinctor]|nr:hypothetical protein F4810DRAFT_708355 [Camillea tinctor]